VRATTNEVTNDGPLNRSLMGACSIIVRNSVKTGRQPHFGLACTSSGSLPNFTAALAGCNREDGGGVYHLTLPLI